MGPEDDPALRDRVVRLLGVLRRAALARTRPVRHLRSHPGRIALVDVADRVRRPTGSEPELLRLPRSDPAFAALHTLYRLVADAPETVELVLATGLLHIPGSTGSGLLHVHVVTQPVTLDRGDDGALVCRLAPDAGVALADDELLDGTGLLDAAAAPGARERVLGKLDTALDDGLVAVLGEWADDVLTRDAPAGGITAGGITAGGITAGGITAGGITAGGITAGGITAGRITVGDAWHEPEGPAPRLVPAPMIVARRRGTSALVACYDRILAELDDPTRPVPVGLAQLVAAIEPADRAAWLERTGAGAGAIADPLLPLGGGTVERRVLARLGRDSGVVVEGPPGTGKTHLIADLVGALLAEGRRVLVTSEKAQALRVLRDQLPEAVRELVVSPVGDDGDVVASVGAIAARSSELDPDAADREIADLAARRAALRTERSERLDALVRARAAEGEVHPEVAHGYAGTPAAIARELARAGGRDGWLVGLVDDPQADAPLAPASLAELRALLARHGPKPALSPRRHQVLPDEGVLPSVGHVAELARTIGPAGPGDPAHTGVVATLRSLTPEAAEALGPAARRAADAVVELAETGDDHGWARDVTHAVLAGPAATLWSRAVGTLAEIDRVLELDRAAGPAQVRVDERADVVAGAEACDRFAAFRERGGAMRRLFRTEEQKALEAHLHTMSVRGVDPRTATGAAAVAHHLRILAIWALIEGGVTPLGYALRRTDHRPDLVEQLLTLRATCLRIGAVLGAAGRLHGLLAALPATERPRLDGLGALERVAAAGLEVAGSRVAEGARRELTGTAARIEAAIVPARRAPEVHAVVDALRRADPDAYAAALDGLADARDALAELRRVDELAAALDDHPRLRDALYADPSDARWARFGPAWAHARAHAWLTSELAEGHPGPAASAEGHRRADGGADQERLDALDDEITALTARLAAAKAWRACLAGLDAEQTRAVAAHRSATAAVGRGTGRHADRFRGAAREALATAATAVPAWVLPIADVLTSLPGTRPHPFDVVVVDEASQADLTSLFLLWLAPRVVVVGDDRQCAPAEVGLGAWEPVFARLDSELPDVPSWLRTQFTPRSSVFSVFRATFGPPLRLREHHRSVPELISWPSREFYPDAPLVPLRRERATRLAPLRATHVAGATSQGEGAALTNPEEATAVADAVAAAALDPDYTGATFGVVVLQGHGQVELIEALLRERLDPDAWDARRLRVGTPADFQGDERTVVWISMVVAPGRRFVALTAERFRRSVNVAATRARDQLWLVHSVTADDLAPADLRRALLQHVTAPSALALPGDAPDGGFRARVHDDLVARGLRVTAGVEVAGHRLDLVVESSERLVVVACDPETTPPAETARARADGEQELRRRGWVFVRVRESAYVLDPAAALTPVLVALGVPSAYFSRRNRSL